jgi:hypothetical protein
VAVVVAGGGCTGGGGDVEDRTAQVTVGDRISTYQVDSCGLDDETVFVVGRADGGRILQAVVALDDDGATGVPAETGFTIGGGTDGPELAAFGAEAWQRRGAGGNAPGEVTGARLEGSRIQASGRAVEVDEVGSPVPGGAEGTVSVDARCDDQTG